MGLDYEKTFAPVIPAAVMRMMLAIVVEADLETLQFDVSGAFLNSTMDKEMYVRPPPGYRVREKGNILKLKKALHGNKQSAMLWHKQLTQVLQRLGFQPCRSAKCLFVRPKPEGSPDLLVVHVDDGCLTGTNQEVLAEVVTELGKEFKVTSGPRPLDFYLGNKIDRDVKRNRLEMSAPACIEELAKRFNMTHAIPEELPAEPKRIHEKNTGDKHDCPYMQLIGALLHVLTRTDPPRHHAKCMPTS